MINPVSGANSVYAVYQQSQVTAPKTRPPETAPPPIDQPKDTYTPSRASDLDHDGDSH